MALITLRDYFFDELGNGVGGIEVNAYPKNSDGTRGGTAAASVTSASGTGKWEIINIDTALAPQTGVFSLRFRNPSTGQIRWREGDVQLQVGFLTGPSGTIPVNDGAVTTAKLADGSVTDAKIGNRTVDQAIATAFGNTGQLGVILSWFAKTFKALKGTTNWYDTPATTLALANTHMTSLTNPHAVTAAQAAAVANAGTAPSIKTGVDSAKGAAGAQGSIYIASDTQMIYRSSGAAWVKVGVSSYLDLDDKPAAAGLPNIFTNIVAGGSTLVPDSTADTLTISAGSGITITGNAGSDTITISAATGGGGVSAHTHPGSDVTSAVGDTTGMDGLTGGKYPYVSTVSQAASVVSANGPFKIAAGSVNVSFTSGLGTLSPGITMSGVLTMLAANGDYDAFTGHVMLKDSSSTSITLKTSPVVTQTVRVNYIIIYV